MNEIFFFGSLALTAITALRHLVKHPISNFEVSGPFFLLAAAATAKYIGV